MNADEQALYLSLYYLDDQSLLNACQVNKRFYQRVCNNIWVQRIMNLVGYRDKQEIDKYMSNHYAISEENNPNYQKYYYYIKGWDETFDMEKTWEKHDYVYLHDSILKVIENGDVALTKIILNKLKGLVTDDVKWDDLINMAHGGFLRAAVKTENPEMVKLLLDLGAAPYIPTDGRYYLGVNRENVTLRNRYRYQSPPLELAARNGNLDIIKLLLDHGAQDDPDNLWGYFINEPVKQNNVKALKLMLDYGAKPVYGETPVGMRKRHPDEDRANNALYIALNNKSYDSLKILLEYGGDKYLTPEFLQEATDNQEVLSAYSPYRPYPDEESVVASKVLDMINILKILEPYLLKRIKN